MFDRPREAARAYNFAAWRFGPLRRDMNFSETESHAEVEMLASNVWLVMREEEWQHQLSIAKADEKAMAQHRKDHPEDV
jgi:hypothetical protein